MPIGFWSTNSTACSTAILSVLTYCNDAVINTPKYKDAENVNDFLKRVYSILDDIKNYEEKNILIVTHNGVCRAINTYFNGIPEDNNLVKLGIQNCEVVNYKIEE